MGFSLILTAEEIQLLFSEGLTTPRDCLWQCAERNRALFGICLYGATRIREACTLRTADVYNRKGIPRSDLIIRKMKKNLITFLGNRIVCGILELRSR